MAKTKKDDNPITVYCVGGFGVKMEQARLDCFRDHPTQKGHKTVYYFPKGKRKVVGTAGGSPKPFLLVLRGHNHPDPGDGLVDNNDGSRSTKYGSFDPRYETDFNKFINPHLATLDTTDVLLDQRHTKEEEYKE